jgi:hypothetical protein
MLRLSILHLIYLSIHPPISTPYKLFFFFKFRRNSLGGGSGYCEAFTTTGQHTHRRIAYIHASSGVLTHDPCIRRKEYGLGRVSQRNCDRLLTLQLRKYLAKKIPHHNANTCWHGCLADNKGQWFLFKFILTITPLTTNNPLCHIPWKKNIFSLSALPYFLWKGTLFSFFKKIVGWEAWS